MYQPSSIFEGDYILQFQVKTYKSVISMCSMVFKDSQTNFETASATFVIGDLNQESGRVFRLNKPPGTTLYFGKIGRVIFSRAQ